MTKGVNMRFYLGMRVRDIGYILDEFKANPERAMLIVGTFITVIVLTYIFTKKKGNDK